MSSATPSTGSPRQLGARAWKGVEPPQVARSNGCGGARGEPQTVAQRSRQRQATTYVYEFGRPCPQFGGRLRAGHALKIGFVHPVQPRPPPSIRSGWSASSVWSGAAPHRRTGFGRPSPGERVRDLPAWCLVARPVPGTGTSAAGRPPSAWTDGRSAGRRTPGTDRGTPRRPAARPPGRLLGQPQQLFGADRLPQRHLIGNGRTHDGPDPCYPKGSEPFFQVKSYPGLSATPDFLQGEVVMNRWQVFGGHRRRTT